MDAIGGDELEISQRSKQRRPRSITADSETYGQAALVREPLRHHRNRRRISEAIAQPADHAEADIQPRQTGGVTAQEESQADEDCAGERNPEGAELVLQPAGDNEAQREDDHRDSEDGGGLRPLPAELLFQRRYEDAPGVERAESDVHHEAADYPPPTVQTGPAGC